MCYHHLRAYIFSNLQNSHHFRFSENRLFFLICYKQMQGDGRFMFKLQLVSLKLNQKVVHNQSQACSVHVLLSFQCHAMQYSWSRDLQISVNSGQHRIFQNFPINFFLHIHCCIFMVLHI